MKFNQKGYTEIVTVSIILGIIGAIFITGVFVWQEYRHNKNIYIAEKDPNSYNGLVSNGGEEKICLDGGGIWKKEEVCLPNVDDYCKLRYSIKNEGLRISNCPFPYPEKEYCSCKSSSYCWDGEKCVDYLEYEKNNQ